MDLRQLQHFMAVAQERHFTRAARRLHIVQSALSASIASLESELGTRLFHRTTRQVHLTTAGETLYEKAGAALAAVREAEQAVRNTDALLTGSLMIGSVQSLPSFIDLPTLLTEFHARHPGVEVRLRQGSRINMPELVLSGELDMAFIPAMPVPARLMQRVIVDDEMVLICSRNHHLAQRLRVDIRQLAEENFVDFQPNWGTRVLVDEQMARLGLSRHTLFEVNDLPTIRALVARGLGVALVPRGNVDSTDQTVHTLSLSGSTMRWRIIALHRKDGGRAVEAFLSLPSLRSTEMDGQ
ncbi:hypothetical protein MB02_07530 [Croceicoccus estronivorus]|uniref:LysR family transcriptional regulator n=1 Tax=Croceicoccus estronivorus TaxID=1172626 RepID=UPI00083539B6|nr:LysR family transcriptional regulator [Croceicoccus estronivorus]OCC24421.1 hypothetical protein MB02_07530 [Croceicoccus estronivorus]